LQAVAFFDHRSESEGGSEGWGGDLKKNNSLPLAGNQ
jgi:hypothetical protein